MRAVTQQGVFIMPITGATILVRGHLGSAPELRHTKDGQVVTNLSLAVEQGYGDRKRTEWVRVTLWGEAQSAAVVKNLSTGDLISVTSESFRVSAWTSKDGSIHGQLEITARRVDYIITKRNPSEASPDEDTEDIPF
jgi:single-strand DNA-binding protein